MAKKVLTDLDLNKNELQNAAVQNLSSAPSNPVEGQFYYNTNDKLTYQWDGTRWIPMGGDPATSTVTVEALSDTTYLKKYVVKQNGAQVGVTIDIPKDMVVQSGSIVTGTWSGGTFTPDPTQPGTGPDKALKLIVANQTAPIYINVADLVDAYTGGTGISISASNEISIVPATERALGGVMIGANITVAADGTISITSANIQNALGNQHANAVYAGPTSGNDALPGFRALVPEDIPELGRYPQITSSSNPALTSSGGICTWAISNSGKYDFKKSLCSVRDAAGNEVICDIQYDTTKITVTINSRANITANTYLAVIVTNIL